MKRRISGGIVVVLIALLLATLLLQKEPSHNIISLPRVHSYMYSDKTESIVISILTTYPEHYYYDTTYINNCAIKNAETSMSFKINKIVQKEMNYMYEDQSYQQVSFYLKPSITMTNSIIQIDNSTLQIQYDNGEELLIDIGEFTYIFDASYNDDLTLGHLSATYRSENDISTVSGINLSLTNNTKSNIIITSIDIASVSVIANTRYLKEDIICEKHTPVANCLGVLHYNDNTSPQIEPLSILMREDQSWNAYIPLSFPSIDHAERFAMIVTYTINGTIKQVILDDFPFLQTTPFQQGYEHEYVTYHIDSDD